MLEKIFLLLAAGSLLLGTDAFSQEEKITLVAVGDIMPAHRLEPFIEKYGPTYPYKDTLSILKEADIAFANLETPLSTKGVPVVNKEYTFRALPAAAEGLKEAGFDVLSLANNHILDYGKEALLETREVLDSKMIFHIGAGENIHQASQPVILQIKDKNFGFLAYSNTLPREFWAEKDKEGTAYGKYSTVKKDVRALKGKVDFVIVSFHWGNEEDISPQEYQRKLAHIAIDSGADIILGHHPHTLRGIEIYKEGIIIYSLGNFAFGSWSERAKEAAIFRFSFLKNELHSLEIIPLDVYNKRVKFQPQILKKEEATGVLEKIQGLSEEFGTKIKITKAKGIITF
jgi:poly-gamma-glutamate synthesis protein (capsule biosynthesis protein)